MDDKLRILLCEDDENLGMLLREYLQAKGYETELYADGDAGSKAFMKSSYDICILDVMMPKKDGFTLAKEIKETNSNMPKLFIYILRKYSTIYRPGIFYTIEFL